MVDVFLTIDVEIWCDGWSDLDVKFPGSFRKYVYGPTSKGDFGLPYQLRLLRDHGLAGIFFTEPLFSRRFGSEPLAEIVNLLIEGGGEVQLHLHPEWVDEAPEPLFAGIAHKLPSMSACTLGQQKTLLEVGLGLLAQAGAHQVNAFRAGGFGLNRDTLLALAAVGIPFDSSYNASMGGLQSGVAHGACLLEPMECEGVLEVPMSNFIDGTSRMRHMQLTACSWAELEALLWQAAEQDRPALTLLWHNFELLNRAKDRADDVVVGRFRRMCQFLDRNRDTFRVRGFTGSPPRSVNVQSPPLRSPRWRTGLRVLEQLSRRN